MEEKNETISKKKPFRFMTLEELSLPEFSKVENFPVRVLGRIEYFIAMKDLDTLVDLINDEKKMKGSTFLYDEEHDHVFKQLDDDGAANFMKAIFSMDTYNLLVDLKKVPSTINLTSGDLMFLSGNIMMERGKIACLVVEAVTEAKNINLELYKKTMYLMKKLVIGSDTEAIMTR